MKNITYNKLVTIVFIALAITITILVALNLVSKPHIRYITVEGDNQNAEFTDQRIKVYFDRPIKRINDDNSQIDFSKFISIGPQTSFDLSWNGNTLFIIPKGILNEDTNYKVTVKKGYEDIYGTIVQSDYNYSFKTKPFRITYLEKNYPDGKDKVVLEDVKTGSTKILAEEDNIKQYSLNKNYLVISKTSNLTEDIKIYNLQTNSVKDLDLQKISVSKIDVSNKLNAFIYISQQVDPKGNYAVPLSNNELKIYNLDTNQITTYNPKDTAKDVLDANLSPDGTSVLYRSSDSLYYLGSINNDNEPINIGKFTGSGGFNKDGTKIIFTSYDPLVVYSSLPFITIFSSDRKNTQVTDGSNYVLDPIFFSNSNNILFGDRTKELLGAQGIFHIELGTLDSKSGKYTFTKLLSDNSDSLELPKISPDDRYIVVEKYTPDALLDYTNQRSFINQRKPLKANLVIFNIKNNKTVREITNAIDAQWVR